MTQEAATATESESIFNQSLLSRLIRDDQDFDKINISQIESLIVPVPVIIIIVSMKTIGLEAEEF